MAPKKTNSQKARERREKVEPSVSSTAQPDATLQPTKQSLEKPPRSLESRKRLTVLALAVLALLFAVAMFSIERWMRDDDPQPTATVQAASSPAGETSAAGFVPDAALSERCWPNGGPVPGNERDAATAPSFALDENTTYSAIITTNYGAFTAEFYPDDAPNTVNNFICLANEGYFNDTVFHRVIAGFMFQGGDPLGTGTGGPGYRFADEPIVRDYVTGTLAMANAGPDTNGSQFFVILDDLTAAGRLPKNYTIFGQVTEGMDVVQAIGGVPVGMSATGENSAPVEPVQLLNVEIIQTPAS
jgi:cyclophilin family peptidyl-prolyl cis-trans isomerase